MKVSNHRGAKLAGMESAKNKAAESKLSKSLEGLSRDSHSKHPSAKVDLSEKAMHMQKAKEIASRTDVDEAKIARLQKLIDAGKYNVKASAIADKLVDNHLMHPEE